MAAATACVMAPTSWVIVMRLERLFPGSAPRAVLAKTVANGLCAAPMISLNFATITLLEGNADPAAVFQNRVGSKLLPTMMNGILYWPIVNAANFRFVALENRPIVGSIAGVIWNVYMSSVINAKQHQHEEGAVPGAGEAKGAEGAEGARPKPPAGLKGVKGAEEEGKEEGKGLWGRWVPAGAVAALPGSIVRFF